MSDYPISVAHAFPRPPPHKIAPQCLRFVTIAKRRMMNSMRSRYRCANGGGDDDDAYCTRVSNAHFLVVPLRQFIHFWHPQKWPPRRVRQLWLPPSLNFPQAHDLRGGYPVTSISCGQPSIFIFCRLIRSLIPPSSSFSSL